MYDGKTYNQAGYVAKVYAESKNVDPLLREAFIDNMLNDYLPNYMTKKDERKWAFVTGGLFVLLSVGLAVWIPNPTKDQHQTFRMVQALSAAGFASFVPGLIEINYSPTVNTALKAGGALAAFVIVYFWLAA